jgi:hypothetical protein
MIEGEEPVQEFELNAQTDVKKGFHQPVLPRRVKAF